MADPVYFTEIKTVFLESTIYILYTILYFREYKNKNLLKTHCENYSDITQWLCVSFLHPYLALIIGCIAVYHSGSF